MEETGAVTQLMFIEPPGMVVQVPTGEMTARPNSILVIISVPVERTLEGYVSISRGGRFCPAESRMSVETAGESFIEVAPIRDWVAGLSTEIESWFGDWRRRGWTSGAPSTSPYHLVSCGR